MIVMVVILDKQLARDAEIRKQEHKNAFKRIGYSKKADHCLSYGHENDWKTDIIAIELNDTK